MRSAITRRPHFTHVGHKAWKVLVIGPKRVDLLDRRVDVDRLVRFERAAVAAYTHQTLHLHIGQPAQQQAKTCGAECSAERVATLATPSCKRATRHARKQ